MKGKIILSATPSEHGAILSGKGHIEGDHIELVMMLRLFFETLHIAPDMYVPFAVMAQHPDRLVDNYQKIELDTDAIKGGR